MRTLLLSLLLIGALVAAPTETYPTSQGPLQVTLLGHGSVMFVWNDVTVYVDPTQRVADFTDKPQADVILITHDHGDHLDKDAIEQLSTDETLVVASAVCELKGQSLANGDSTTVKGIGVLAVPAYNILHKRDNGQPYHPKGRGNGYVLMFADKTVYVAGDTELVPEMQDLPKTDIAFLPMLLPYTMDTAMVAQAARQIKPTILYPYHYRSGVDELREKLADTDIQIVAHDNGE